MKTLSLILLVVLATAVSHGQTPAFKQENGLKGKIESVTYQRTYLVWKFKSVEQVPRILYIERFDRKGNLVQSSTFGSIERRIMVDLSGNKPFYKVLYFDFAGNLIRDGSASFSPPWKEPSRADLCNDFSDTEALSGNVKTITETCRDGTFRVRDVVEKDERGLIIRKVETDAKENVVTEKYEYDSNADVSRWAYEVDAPGAPRYLTVTQFAETKRDSHGNWIRDVATVTERSYRNPTFQFVEEQLIKYYDDK